MKVLSLCWPLWKRCKISTGPSSHEWARQVDVLRRQTQKDALDHLDGSLLLYGPGIDDFEAKIIDLRDYWVGGDLFGRGASYNYDRTSLTVQNAPKTVDMGRHLFVGPLIHTKPSGELSIVPRAAILVQDGKFCTSLTHAVPLSEAHEDLFYIAISEFKARPSADYGHYTSHYKIINITENPKPSDVKADFVTLLSAGQFFIPGFIDCHIHAPQMPNLGIGYDKGLLEWLETYTFPLERQYADDKFAERIFDAVVKRTLTVGTTTACYFASLYATASLILGQKAAHYGQRAFIGKVNMDRSRPDGYHESTEKSVTNTKNFIKDINSIGSQLVKPVITPRFALSCSLDLLKELGQLANDSNVHVQTHVSETLDEIEAVKMTFPEISTYTEVYKVAGLLTRKTVLAHGIFLGNDELDIIKENKSAVVHCPSSNTCLRSGLCDVRRLMSRGIKIGLGTDVSGGTSTCMLDAMRSAIQVSNHLAVLNADYEPLKYTDVFHLATLGGATALAIDDKVGNFEVGKEFDALVIDLGVASGPLDNLIDYTLEDKLQRLIYSGDDRNIVEVYVHGRRVK